MPDVIIPKFRPKEDKGWWDTVIRNIHLGIGKEKVLIEQRQKEIAEAEKYMKRKTVDGLGQLIGVIDLKTYLLWDQDQRGCWSDKKFKREFFRDNPDARATRPEKKYI